MGLLVAEFHTESKNSLKCVVDSVFNWDTSSPNLSTQITYLVSNKVLSPTYFRLISLVILK